MTLRSIGVPQLAAHGGAVVLALALALAVLGCGGGPDATPGAPDAAPPAPDAPLPGDGDVDAAPAGVARELDGRLTINELMAANAVTLVDDAGTAGDWVELWNPTDEDLALEGYALTDDLDVPRKAVLGAGVLVPAGGHLVIWLDGLGLALPTEGGALALARPDGSPIDRVVYAAQAVDFSAAREPDGSDAWVIEWHPSPGVANPAGGGLPMGLEAPGAAPESVPAAGDLSERILGYDVVPAFALTVAPADVAALEVDPTTYVRATLTFEGRAYGPVGLRVKGANSFQPFSQKPSLRINVDEYVPGARFFGQRDLTLNNMDDDPSMMHERLAYLVAREAGLPASRSNHAVLAVNGVAYGLYAHVEPVKGQLLRRWFVDDTGPLFEATDVDFVAADVARFELETGPDDRTLLVGLADALALPTPDAAIVAAGAFVDLDQFQRYWALATVIGQFDAFPYSNPGDDYHLYADPLSGRLVFIPWGMDETFFSASFDVLDVRSVLARTCLASTPCFQGYVDRAWELLAMTEAFDLAAERTRVAAQLAPLIEADVRKPYTTAFVRENQAAQGFFIGERRLWLTRMLPPPSP